MVQCKILKICRIINSFIAVFSTKWQKRSLFASRGKSFWSCLPAWLRLCLLKTCHTLTFPWQLYPHDKCIFWYHSASFWFISAQKIPYGPFPSPHLSQHAKITYYCKKWLFCLFRGVVYWIVWVGQCLSLSSISIMFFVCIHQVTQSKPQWEDGKRERIFTGKSFFF